MTEGPSLHHLFAKGQFDDSLPRNYSPRRLGLPPVTDVSPFVRRPRFHTVVVLANEAVQPEGR